VNAYNVALMFGQPERTQFIEDIALRFSLEELKAAFYQILDTTTKRHEIENPYPLTETPHIIHTVRQITKELHSHTLYKYLEIISIRKRKNLIYQASLLKKSARNYKRSFLVTNELFTQHIEDLM
jgi:hypothetical protein